ncbi:MAG: hypothetical protein IKJ55_06485 [Clostridia bacterium]|nr:hypothetical protein [Clostridia bacterium]
MFEIFGTFKKDDARNGRLTRYFTKTFFSEDTIDLVPPCYAKFRQFIATKNEVILSFRSFRYENAPYVTKTFLTDALEDFSPVKEKTVVELSPISTDFNLKTGIAIPMNGNQAVLRATIKGCPLFYDEHKACAYFTYLSDAPHLVWVENTRSLAEKHNLIKKAGFKGIYWRNPYDLPEGNWEAMYEIYNKRNQ